MIVENIQIAIDLDQFINKLQRGDIYEDHYEEFTNFFNKAILFTAGNEETNKDLEEVSEMIISLLQLPVIDPELLIVLLQEFQKRLLNAHHGHATVNEHIEQYAKIQILSNKEILTSETLSVSKFKKLESKVANGVKRWVKKT